MKIVIATDSFKGSLTANEAVAAIARGVARAIPAAELVCVPLGDGGEGTVDALVAAVPGSRRLTRLVIGPFGALVDATYGLLGLRGLVAVVEMAAASGITLVPREKLNPMRATTYGTGELLGYALSRPVLEEMIIGIGGSATNDGGAGALQALGAEFIDANGDPITDPMTPELLGSVVGVTWHDHSLKVDDVRITVACDVTNPLLGPTGASAVFGPQKGATPEMVSELDSILTNFAPNLEFLARQRGGPPDAPPIAHRPGSGAAGGLGAALMALFPAAEFKSGIDVVLDAVGFDSLLSDADLVITGEGKLDPQTLSGKAIDGVLRRAKAASVPVIAFAGAVDADAARALEPLGLESAYAILPRAASVADAMARAGELLEQLAAEVIAGRV